LPRFFYPPLPPVASRSCRTSVLITNSESLY
jgi:hypothetical protein